MGYINIEYMNKKLEVGMYIRYKTDGHTRISRLIKKDKERFEIVGDNKIHGSILVLGNTCIREASYNLIDLIHIGDYINGYKVISKDYSVKENNIDCIELDLNNNYQHNFISINQIESIITKEQMSQIGYKVGE